MRPHGGPTLLAVGDLAPTRPLMPATPANNHALDHGAEGLSETLSSLHQVGIAAVGGGRNAEEAVASGRRTVRWRDGGHARHRVHPPAGVRRRTSAARRGAGQAKSRLLLDAVTLDEQPGMAPWVETELSEQDVLAAERWVAAAREEADLVVVHVHWGVPNGWCAAFQGPLADYQRPLGRRLVEAGADHEVGHHPHVVHGVEAHAGGLIAYSLGNFFFHGMAEAELVLGRFAEHSARLGTELEVSDGVAQL